MRAAAEAWGSRTHVFHQGFAKETHDPAIVAATMAKPGVVLRRRVGSNDTFTEHAELPKNLPVEKLEEKPARHKAPPPREADSKAARAAALAFETEQKRREMERRKEEAARKKERKPREQVIAKAERTLEQAKQEHETRVKKIEKDRAAVDRRLQSENARWEQQKEKLERALRKARD